MNHRERFQALMQFQAVDRLPMVEWAGWWDKTVARWHSEGLPEALTDAADIRAHLGLDPYYQMWLPSRRATFRGPAGHGLGVIHNMDSYRAIRPDLYPDPEECVDHATLAQWADQQARGEAVIWITLEGFFWFPRTLFGIAEHLTAYYEDPETLMAINEDLLHHQIRILDRVCAVCRPDFMTFAEDMSYNHGPMISGDLFRTFLTPFYQQVIPRVADYGIIPFIDTDGDVTQLIPWFEEVGVDGFLPLERQAGCDIGEMREQHPRVRLVGAFDKMVMTQGEAAIRQEFERILPVMKQGGFIPSVDHQTPPGVSLTQYHDYVRCLHEYSRLAALTSPATRSAAPLLQG